MLNSSIWPIARFLSGATTPRESGSWTIPQSSSITGTWPSDCLMSYPGRLLGCLTPPQRCSYRTLHSYNLIWAVCHLFLKRWRKHTYSVSGNNWPGEPRGLRKTTSARKFRDLESMLIVWFRTKTDKGIVCLADHLHSVTSGQEKDYSSTAETSLKTLFYFKI